MELYIGKKFKLEVWEACLKTMREDEVSSFIIDKSVSNQLRFFVNIALLSC